MTEDTYAGDLTASETWRLLAEEPGVALGTAVLLRPPVDLFFLGGFEDPHDAVALLDQPVQAVASEGGLSDEGNAKRHCGAA